MAYFFDDELPSTSKALSNCIPGIEGEQETEDLSMGEASKSPGMNQSIDEPFRTTIDEIDHKAGELVKTINISRTCHQKWMANYEEKLSEKMKEKCQQLNDLLVTVYEENTKMLEVKLAELTATLNNCQRLNQELMEATQALSHLRDCF